MSGSNSSSDNIRLLNQMLVFQQLHNEALQKNEEAQNHWKKLVEDYGSLEQQLTDLPRDLTKDVMVPVGPRALMKGKIVHTNEILVCLGDGWFAKRSAMQASEICKRRLALCKDTLSALEREKKLLSSRKELPIEEEAYKEKEIVEVCTEEELEQWRVEHRHKEKEYYKQLAEMRSKERTTIDSQEALWKRLDELELQEELEDELNRLHDGDDSDLEDEDDDSEVSDNEMKNEEGGTSFDAYFAGGDVHGENGLIRRKVVVQAPRRRVSFPDRPSEKDEETEVQTSMTSSPGRRVSFVELPPEEIPVDDESKNNMQDHNLNKQSDSSSKETPASELTMNSLSQKNHESEACNVDQLSQKIPKSILKIKSSDPATIYPQESRTSALEDDEADSDRESKDLQPPVTSEVLEHSAEKMESLDSGTKRPISRFRAARNNKR